VKGYKWLVLLIDLPVKIAEGQNGVNIDRNAQNKSTIDKIILRLICLSCIVRPVRRSANSVSRLTQHLEYAGALILTANYKTSLPPLNKAKGDYYTSKSLASVPS
jgi:hypothetical protein